MIDGKRVLALIPARGGSKNLPRKNILPLAGKPLIAWSIEAALECDFIDMVLVSSDDDEIREKAVKYGASAPFRRPDELATDTSATMETIFHTLDWLDTRGEHFDYLLLLQPTSPLRTSRHIIKAFELLKKTGGKAIVSVCETDHPPQWSNTLPPDQNMANFLPKNVQNIPRQQLPIHYRINGAIYLAETDTLRKTHSFLTPETFAMIMEREDSVDIDSRLDFDLANLILKRRSNNTETDPSKASHTYQKSNPEQDSRS